MILSPGQRHCIGGDPLRQREKYARELKYTAGGFYAGAEMFRLGVFLAGGV
jgi:hypothetical protein